MSRLCFVVPIVALVLPLAFLFASGPIEADPTALSTVSPAALAYPPSVANDCCLPSVYYGVHVPGWLDNLDALTAFEDAARKRVSIVMWYQGWGVTDGTQYFQTSWMNNVRRHGSIPMVTWEPWLYTEGITQTAFQLGNIISGTFDSYIKDWAVDSKAWGHPYFLRFAPEMNGDWFPWSEQVNGNTSGEYVLAWQHVHDIFTDEGATNVSWVWSPNIEYDGSTPLEGLYPGDDYVDWVGMDGYNWGTVPHGAHTASLEGTNTNPSATVTGWQTFSQIFTQTYTHITALSTKPLMVAETASAEQGGSKADWIIDAYFIQVPRNFAKIKAIIWFNENKETDWRIQSSPAAQNAFGAAIDSCFYATNRYASLCISPIPIPSLVVDGGACHVYLPLVSK